MTLKIHFCLTCIYLFGNKVRNRRWQVRSQLPAHYVDALRAAPLFPQRALGFRNPGRLSIRYGRICIISTLGVILSLANIWRRRWRHAFDCHVSKNDLEHCSNEKSEAKMIPEAQRTNAKRFFLYQIAYSDETWKSVPKDVLPLDNRANEKPDWAEYWPIRRFLQNEPLDDNAFYGFISPRFEEKMLCTTAEVIDFVTNVADDVDVAAFSPFIDLRALFLNIFEQGEFSHPGHMDLCCKIFKDAMPGVDIRNLVNTTNNAIFCNFFAAKPRFWRAWLALCEQVFAMAESPAHPYSVALNRPFAHRGASQAKVFVIERIASLLLAASADFRVAVFKETTVSNPFSNISPDVVDHLTALKDKLVALKSDNAKQRAKLLKDFYKIQREMLSGEDALAERSRLIAESLEHGIAHAPSKGYEHWKSAPPGMLYAQRQIGIGRLLQLTLFGK